MGDGYTIGVAVGVGVGLGVLVAGLLGARAVVAALVAAAGAAIGAFVIADVEETVGAAIGGLAGALGAIPLVRGALSRGGTRVGTAALVAGGAIALAALALVPIVGYLHAIVVPVVGARLRRRESDRHAGLRTLARD